MNSSEKATQLPITGFGNIEAPQVKLRLKVLIGKICILRLVMLQRNAKFLSNWLPFLFRFFQRLPRAIMLKYQIEVEVPYKEQTEQSYTREGGLTDLGFVLESLKLIGKFFRKCSEAEVFPESLTQEEAEAYEEIKKELNSLVHKLFVKVDFKPCLSQELPELFPKSYRVEAVDVDLCSVNNRLFIQDTAKIPAYVLERLSGCIPPLPSAPIVWVEDPINEFLMPFIVSDYELGLIKDLISGKVNPKNLPKDVAKVFYLARIVVEEKLLKDESQKININQQSSNSLQQDSYLVFRNLLNPLQIAAYRSYYRTMESSGLMRVDSVSEHRLFRHNELLAKFVHVQLETLLNKILPEKIKKSYCFARAHKGGAILKRHVDRPQCEWNISLIFDMGPERKHEVPWPIYLEIDGEAKEVLLQMGDAVLYQGTKIPHWRNELPAGHKTTAIFFHFVNENFEGSLN